MIISLVCCYSLFDFFFFFSVQKPGKFLQFGESTPERNFTEEISRETTWDVCRKAAPAPGSSSSSSIETDKVNSIDYICPSILLPSAAAPSVPWNRSIEGCTCNPRDQQYSWKSFLTFGIISPDGLVSEIDETTKCEQIKV